MDGAALQVLCARRGWTIVKPEFPHDDAHIRHSMPEVATPEKPHPARVRIHALSGEWQAMSLIGNKRAPKHTQRFLGAKAGSPTRREVHGDGTPIVVGQSTTQ